MLKSTTKEKCVLAIYDWLIWSDLSWKWEIKKKKRERERERERDDVLK